MNIVSFILILVSIVIFALTFRGHRYGSLGLGLALAHTGWLLHVLWAVDHLDI